MLDKDERAKLDDVFEFVATMGNLEEMGGLTWDNLVWRAQHANTAHKLALERAKMHTRITGFGPTKVAEATTAVDSVKMMITEVANGLGKRRLVGHTHGTFKLKRRRLIELQSTNQGGCVNCAPYSWTGRGMPIAMC